MQRHGLLSVEPARSSTSCVRREIRNLYSPSRGKQAAPVQPVHFVIRTKLMLRGFDSA